MRDPRARVADGVRGPQAHAAIGSTQLGAVATGTTPVMRTPAEPQPEAPSAPTLDDVARLTRESDFSPFVARDVDPGVRNAAMKKLFSDPHFNIPDPYEAYSGDYTGGEPIPPAMLATLEQMKALLKTPPAETTKKEVSQEEKPQPDEPGRQNT